MCGLALLADSRLTSETAAARIRVAVRRLTHRGPDASAVCSQERLAIGHTRLAIVGLCGGAQPLKDPSGRWTLAFNGEIYNFKRLRDDLKDRWCFRDESDTEVLLAGLVLEGADFIRKLDGMWAFALHDNATASLILARDRFGKKPLYYRVSGSAFACASELPALRALMPDANWREDPRGVSDYFRYGYTLPGTTCLDGVREVLPAHVLLRSADGNLISERYWTPSTEPWKGTFDEAAEEIRALLVGAVRTRQLAADVEVGAFLSGGVDSTVVCALAQRSGFGRLRTFTAGFAEPTYDERRPAARAALELSTLHTERELSLQDAAQFALSLPERIGQPFGDASIVPTALVAELAARDVKVVLTGDGGDEVFGGYARYVGRMLRQYYRLLPQRIRFGFERVVLAFPEPIEHHSGSLLKRAHLFVALGRDDSPEYVAPPAMRPEVMAKLVPGMPKGYAPPPSPWPAEPDEIRHMILMDWLVWLPQDILAKVDRATMAFSVEARSPFLDRDLVELVVRLPWTWHFSLLRGKRLLRAAMRELVPDFVWRRRKQGFASPVGYWMNGEIGDELHRLTYEKDTGPIDASALRKLLTQHRDGRHDNSSALWLAYTYLGWKASAGI